tara:strand:- start:116 stop:703 length:588 start_codon:yes stop_codon:yes gene_type:complete
MSINTKKFFDKKTPVKDTRFNPSLMDRKYDYTETDKDGNTIISARFMGDQEVKDRLSKTYANMGMEMEGGGYLPNVGKKAVDTAAGITGGIKSLNKDGNPLDQVLSASGMNRSDAAFAINSQIQGTDAYHMQQVAKSINLSVDQQRGVTTVIQPQVRTVTVPVSTPTPVGSGKGKSRLVPVPVPVNNNSIAKIIR